MKSVQIEDLVSSATPHISLVRPVLPKFDAVEQDVRQILASGMVTKGEYLRTFEDAVAKHLGVKHAIGVSSCTTGLMLVYRCLGLTGSVIVPSFTFMATVSALIWADLRPVFADVDRGTTDLDPTAVEAAITDDTSAIVATHNFGNPADIDQLTALARRHGLKLIFDAAHGFGARYQGTPVGGQGDAQSFSLSPTKLLIAGEGGIVATDDDALAEQIIMGREYGNNGRYDSAFAGFNARMPEFNAVLGLRSLDQLEAAATRRNAVVKLFADRLLRLPGIGFQEVRAGNRCSYKDLSIVVDGAAFGRSRDELLLDLAAEGIDTRTYYDPPVHRHAAYRRFYTGQPLPNTEFLAARSVSLPIWSDMDDTTVEVISGAIERAHQRGAASQ
jgi:dTDP-4-amino-4,6-dideoxygalactose transaminase